MLQSVAALLLITMASAAAAAAAGQGQGAPERFVLKPHPRGYVAHRASAPPPIDGKVQGPGWDDAEWTDAFVDIEGPSKPQPYRSTRVKMLWDDAHLYVGAWLEEPHPWAHLVLHDDVIFRDNDFEVFIDPDGDNHQYYEFEINALGTWWDLFLPKPYRDGGPAIHSFESVAPSERTQSEGPTGWLPVRRAVWVDGKVNAPPDDPQPTRGWGVTLAFPWSLLKQAAHHDCPPKPGDQWRINFSRVQWEVVWDEAKQQYVKQPPEQSEHNWVWSPQWAIAMHQPEYWGYLQFSDAPVDARQRLPAQDEFAPDPTWALRSFLMEAYYRQKARWEERQEFAGSLEELGLVPPEELAGPHSRLRVQATEASFIATGQLAAAQGGVRRLYVNEEGRLWERLLPAPEGAQAAAS